MYQLQMNDRISEALSKGFDKTIYSVKYGDFAAMAGPELFNQTMDRIRTFETPMYFGEAEIMLLKPLKACCQANVSNLTQRLFAQAGTYGIIEEIAKLSSTRDLAAGLSKDTVINHPVIQQLIMMGIFDNRGSQLDQLSESSEAGPSVTIDASPKDVMSIITQALSGCPIRSSNGEQTDVISLLNGLYSMGRLEDNQDKIGNVLTDLQQTMKMGKRYPMTEAERQKYFTDLLLPIVNWLSKKANAIFQGNISLTDTNYTDWADFMIVARWLNFYLDCVEKYDEVFPTQLIPSQSQTQVAEIARAANRYKGLFLKLTQSSMTSALSWSFYLWDQMFNFFKPFMPTTSKLSDLQTLVAELKEDYDQVKDPWADSMVHATFDRMRTLSGADVIFDFNMSNVAKIPMLIHQVIASQAANLEVIPTGSDTLAHVAKYSQIFKLSQSSQESIFVVLSNIASSFNASVSAMMQANQFITRDFKLPIQENTMPDSEFHYVYSAKPLTLLPQKADFTRKDETVRTYAPWTINRETGRVEWAMVSFINTLARVKSIQDLMVSESVSTIYWPPMASIQVGEPYIAMMAKQPVIAPYTQNVTSDMLPLSWTTWFKIWATHSPETRPENVLSIAATAVAQDTVRNEGPIATCFAAVAAIAHWEDGDSQVKILRPNIPWVYGVPFEVMVRANHVAERVDMNHSTSMIWSSQLDDDLAMYQERGMWYVDAFDITGSLHHFCFCLWKVAPGLTDLTLPETECVRWTIEQLVKGSYFTVPVRRDFFSNSNHVDYKNTGSFDWDDDQIVLDDSGNLVIQSSAPKYWVGVKGFCPVALTLPHLTWDMATPCEDELSSNSELLKGMFSFINIPVRYRFNDYDRSISFMAQYNNPAVLIEYRDFEDAASSDKVLPNQKSDVKASFPDQNTDKGNEAPAGTDNAAKPESTLSTAPEVSSVANATMANPLFKVETTKGDVKTGAMAMNDSDPSKAKEIKGRTVPGVHIDPSSPSDMTFHPAQAPQSVDMAPDQLNDMVFNGDPHDAVANEEPSGQQYERPQGSKRDKRKKKGQDEDDLKMDGEGADQQADV